MSRVLFTIQPVYGHLHPLMPLARALEEAGHDVAFATAAGFRPVVEANGFRCFAAGLDFLLTATLDWVETFPEFADVPPEERIAFSVGHQWGKVTAFNMVEDAKELLNTRLADVHSDFGLPPDPDSAMRYRHLVMYFAPPSLQDPELASLSNAHALRAVPFDRSGTEDLPAWMDRLPDRPNVTMTLGTVFSRHRRFFDAAIEGLRDEPVSHAGFNTLMAAVTHGLPHVMIPLAADQPNNARRAEALGFAEVVTHPEVTPERLRDAVKRVLASERHRDAGKTVRNEWLGLPGIEWGVALVEALLARGVGSAQRGDHSHGFAPTRDGDFFTVLDTSQQLAPFRLRLRLGNAHFHGPTSQMVISMTTVRRSRRHTRYADSGRSSSTSVIASVSQLRSVTRG